VQWAVRGGLHTQVMEDGREGRGRVVGQEGRMMRRYRRQAILFALGSVVVVAAFVVAVARASQGGPFTGTIVVRAGLLSLVIDSRSGHTFVVNANSDSISMIDTARGTVVRTIDVGGQPGMLAVDGRTGHAFVLTSSHTTGPASVDMLDSHTGLLLRTTPVGQAAGYGASALTIDEQRGRVIVTDGYESRVSVLDARTGVVLRAFTAGLDPSGVTIDPRSGQAYVADSSENKVLVLDVAHGRVLRVLPVAGSPSAMGLDASATHLYVTGHDLTTSAGSMAALDVRSGRVLVSAGEASVVVADLRTGALYSVDSAVDSLFVTAPHTPTARKVVSWGGFDSPATVGGGTGPATIDPRTGRIFILMEACGQRLTPSVTGCVRVVDPRAGLLIATIPVGRAPSALAIDSVTGRVFVTNSQWRDAEVRIEADWAPSWLRDRFPWLLAPSAGKGGPATGTVSVFDAPR